MTEPKEKKGLLSYYHLPTWLTLGNLILLVTLSFNFGSVRTEFKEGIEQNAKEIIEIKKDDIMHETNQSVHMPFDRKIEVFMTRNEIQAELKTITNDNKQLKQDNKDIKAQLNRIEKKL